MLRVVVLGGYYDNIPDYPRWNLEKAATELVDITIIFQTTWRDDVKLKAA